MFLKQKSNPVTLLLRILQLHPSTFSANSRMLSWTYKVVHELAPVCLSSWSLLRSCTHHTGVLFLQCAKCGPCPRGLESWNVLPNLHTWFTSSLLGLCPGVTSSEIFVEPAAKLAHRPVALPSVLSVVFRALVAPRPPTATSGHIMAYLLSVLDCKPPGGFRPVDP